MVRNYPSLILYIAPAPNIMKDVDFSKVEGRLAGMNKQQLLDFVIKTGNIAKNEQCEITKGLTKDKEDMLTISKSMTERLEFKKKKLDQVSLVKLMLNIVGEAKEVVRH